MPPAKIPEGSPMTAQGLSAERLICEALENARSQLITLGGDPRMIIAEFGSAEGDEIQAAVLDAVDAALPEVTRLRAIADGLAGACKEMFELADNWPGVAYTADLHARVTALISTYDSDKAGK